MGFRDDIDAITDFLPKTPVRQTFLFSATVSRSIQQIARSTLDKNHIFINTVSDSDVPVHVRVAQYHTVLPSASEQIPHILRLLAHDQLINPGKSKAIVFLPTTKMTQLFATLLRELSKTSLPSLQNSRVYEIHSKRTQEARTMTSDSFRGDNSGASILVTSDVSARGVDYPGVTRVIQVGIPGSTDQYIHRVGRTGRAGTSGRGDIVLLPWESGFLTWQLTDMPLKPLTVSELRSQVKELSAKFDADPDTFFKDVDVSSDGSPRFDRHGRRVTSGPNMYRAPLSPVIENMGQSISNLLQNIDEDAVKETFASLLGYYIAKSPELRAQKGVLVQGCKDWTVEACGLSIPPFVSEAFLTRLGYSDGRTKRFGSVVSPSRQTSGRGSSWMGRGAQKNKGREISPHWASVESVLDENDPVGRPEDYRSQRYGKEGGGSRDYDWRSQTGGSGGMEGGGSRDDNNWRSRAVGSGSGFGRNGGGGFGRGDFRGQRDAGESGYGMRR
jgi:ATP-dependent RNA helicase MSS116